MRPTPRAGAYNGGDFTGGSGSTNNTYRNVEAYGNGNGITAYSGSDGTAVIDSNVHDNRGYGIQFGWLNSWSVTGSTVTHNQNGLTLDSSSHGNATDNDLSNNIGEGFRVAGGGSSQGNVISGNRIKNNGTNGVDLSNFAVGNRITDNVISGNAVGVLVKRNDTQANWGNRFVHNTFSDNAVNATAAEERNGGNLWDDGYPSGGNSWDDATGADLHNGPAQDNLGSDGIVDSPHAVPGAADVDRYPIVWHQPPAPFRFTVDRGGGPGFGFIDGQGFAPGQEIDRLAEWRDGDRHARRRPVRQLLA